MHSAPVRTSQDAADRLGDVGIIARDQVRRLLDHGHARAEFRDRSAVLWAPSSPAGPRTANK
jgi:hypothetical protein